MRMSAWELSLGLYPGILLGFRSYVEDKHVKNHVLYIPFVDICLTLEYEKIKEGEV